MPGMNSVRFRQFQNEAFLPIVDAAVYRGDTSYQLPVMSTICLVGRVMMSRMVHYSDIDLHGGFVH